METRQSGLISTKVLVVIIPEGKIMGTDHSLLFVSIMLQILK